MHALPVWDSKITPTFCNIVFIISTCSYAYDSYLYRHALSAFPTHTLCPPHHVYQRHTHTGNAVLIWYACAKIAYASRAMIVKK